MKLLRAIALPLMLAIVFIGLSSIYTVREGQKGVLLRLGKMELNKKTGKPDVKLPGLHFKIPFINSARIFDTRIQTLDIESSRIVTAEKKDVLVDYFAKWRIKDLPLYFTRTGGSPYQAETLLEQKLNNSLRAEFGKRSISEVVSGERADIMAILKQQANVGVEGAADQGLGIEVIDVRIKRIDLPSEVSTAVYERMRAERERIATEHRAEGKSVANATRAEADAKVTVVLAQANSKSKQIRGQGDGDAARIYADAYKVNPSFYTFYRSLIAYRHAFKDQNDILVLKPDNHFFRYFNEVAGNTHHKKIAKNVG